MIQFCLLAILFTAVMSEDVKFHKCEMTWKKIGCFKDLVGGKRALPDQLVNIRDPSSKVFQPPRLNWTLLADSWRSLACQCAKATRDKGYKVFGLQFYGECWSGKNGTYNRSGEALQERCVMDLVSENNKLAWKYCEIASEQACVGQANTNYVYMLKEEPSSPGDGDWSEWGYWTKCDKTCGTGKQVRERTCTNPPPDSQGKNCEGPAEENRSCNLMECPIDGGFTPWEPLTDCTKTCGSGTQTFVRTCTNPPPQHGGYDCNGPKEKIGSCNKFPCPVPCTRAVDLGVILDATNSVGRKNFNVAKEFVLDLVYSMSISKGASHFGLIVYNIQAEVIVRFNELEKQDPDVIKAILKETKKLRGQTFTDRALREAGEKLFTVQWGNRPNKPNVLVVLTDGKTNPRGEPYETALEPLKEWNVKVIAVGVGTKIKQDELTRIAMGKKENVVQVSDFGKLVLELQKIIDASCPQNCE